MDTIRPPEEAVIDQCSATIDCCIDFRLQDQIGSFFQMERGEDFQADRVTAAGGCLDLARGTEAEKAVRIKDLSVSVSKHRPEEVILVIHTHCAAYESLVRRCMVEQEIALDHMLECERQIQVADAHVAADYLRSIFPFVTVRLYRALVDPAKRRMVGLQRLSLMDNSPSMLASDFLRIEPFSALRMP